MRRTRTGLPILQLGSSLGGAEWLLFKILLSGIRSNPKRTRERATFSRLPYSAGLAYSSPCRSCFSTSTFQVTGSKTSPLLVRMMPSSCAKRAPHPAGSGAFTEFSVILPRAAATSSKKEQPDMRSLILVVDDESDVEML